MNEIEKIIQQAKLNTVTTKGIPGVVDGCYIVSKEKLEDFYSLIKESVVKEYENSMVSQNESRCANCGKPASQSKECISDYPEDGEWFCSVECKDQHDELGCPHETHNGYRHPIESKRLIECENVLRSLASWLGVGGYNAPQVDPKIFEEKIRFGVNEIRKVSQKNSWSGQVDRQSGAFDDSELRGRDGWS